MSISYPTIKRAFDFFFSLFALTLFSPLIALITFAIKFTSKGPVFYTSTRLGKNFKKIQCLKFRTMYTNADTLLEELLKQSPENYREWKLYNKLKKDPRITPIGRILRQTSLDELPQFISVLCGDLSVVGPRPFVANFKNPLFDKKAALILSVKPGITGLWQTSGRSKLTIKHRLRLEVIYVKRRSFLLDLFLILKTIPTVLDTRGAH